MCCVRALYGQSPSGASSSLLKGLDHQGVKNCCLLLFLLSHLRRRFFVVIPCKKKQARACGEVPLHSPAGPLPLPGLTQKGSDPLKSDAAWEANQGPAREKAKAFGGPSLAQGTEHAGRRWWLSWCHLPGCRRTSSGVCLPLTRALAAAFVERAG